MNQNRKVRPLARSALLLLGAGLLAILPLRLYQLMSLIEQDTGFYTNASHWSVTALYILLGVLCVAFVALGFTAQDIPLEDLPKKKNPVLAGAAGLFSIGLFSEFILRLIDAFNLFTSSEEKWGMTQMSSKMGGIVLFLHSALALAACFYFLIYACTLMGNGLDYRSFPMLAVMPALWLMLRLIERFLQPMNYRNVSEIFLELFTLVFMLLFFWYFARVSSNLDAEKKMNRCYAFGIPAAMFIFVASVPRLVLLLCGWKAFLVKGSPVQWCDLAAAVFLLCYLFCGLKERDKQGRMLQ